jgi:hypothetical protein
LAYTAIIDETGLNSDYNLFYNVTSSQDFVRITPSRYATFAVWKTFGYDTHSLKAASVADIKFTNVAGYPVSCQTMDLRILATSPAVNAGVTLSGFANDMNSTVRPQGIAWDIGAYEAIITVMPVITTQPVNMAVTAGQTATFLIAASGTAPLAYQWQRSNDNGTTWNTVSGATSATYTTPATVTSDNGAKFRCLATNTAGSATSNAGTLTVNTVSKLSGTAFGTTPSQAPGYEYNKASDNDSNTYFEYALNNGGYTGIDLGSGNACKIAKIRFHSHPGFEFRMAGGKFQGSTTSSSSGYVDLYTIPATPPAGWNEIQTTDQNSYRYLRFFSAVNVYCTIAEMEFYGTISNPLSKKTAVSGGTPMRALPKEFSLSPVMNSRNPSSVQVIFAAPVALSEVRFDLFNLQGRCIETVVRHGSQPGYSSIEFSNSGSKLTAGNYLCRVHSQGFEKTIKLLVR